MERTLLQYSPKTSPENIFIRLIWYVKDVQSVQRTETILPKGTAEIIFNLSEGAHAYKSDVQKPFCLPRYFINGCNFSPYHLSFSSTQHFIGIQLNVFALKYLFNTPASAFNDQVLNGALVCKSLDILADRLAERTSFEEQVVLILQWFREKLAQRAKCEINHPIIRLHADPELTNLSVKGMSEKYNLSARHLSRLCTEYLGMCTEDVILYRKYLASLHKIHQPGQSLTQITFDCGFYDQPHFARTFKLFTGLSPKQYKNKLGEVPGHVFEKTDKSLALAAQ